MDNAEYNRNDHSQHAQHQGHSVPAAHTWDLLLIRPGASIPADGEVIEGQSSVNEAMITGESHPVKKGPGAKVIGGTIDGDGSLRVRVTATSDEMASCAWLSRPSNPNHKRKYLQTRPRAGCSFSGRDHYRSGCTKRDSDS